MKPPPIETSTIEVKEDVDFREPPTQTITKDIDMRFPPPAVAASQSAPVKEIKKIIEIASPEQTIMSPSNSDESSGVYKKPTTPTIQVASMMSPPPPSMMSPPGMVDYSQYLKDSNLKDDEDDDELRIDESYCNSDYDEDKKDQSEIDHSEEDANKNNFEMTLLPPAFDTKRSTNAK